MVDRTVLKEAVVWFDGQPKRWPEEWLIAEAARAVVEAPEVWWCETHNAEGIENHGGESDECWRVVWVDRHEKQGVGWPYNLCRMVVVYLVPKEQA
jgi:hypothetical protein